MTIKGDVQVRFKPYFDIMTHVVAEDDGPSLLGCNWIKLVNTVRRSIRMVIRSEKGTRSEVLLEQHKNIYSQFRGDLHLKPPKFEHIFVAVITFFSFLLCKYFLYQLVVYCVCFKMIYKKSL